MNILRYRPISSQDAFRRDLEQALERYAAPAADGDDSAVATADWVPSVDIREEPSRFVLCADLPGMEPADIEVSMDKGGILTLKGERKVATLLMPGMEIFLAGLLIWLASFWENALGTRDQDGRCSSTFSAEDTLNSPGAST